MISGFLARKKIQKRSSGGKAGGVVIWNLVCWRDLERERLVCNGIEGSNMVQAREKFRNFQVEYT